MSDNLCGPSAPTKGLINQLDRDKSLHQNRTVVVTSRGPFDKNFRTAAEATNSGAKDAALNEFLVGPNPPGSLAPFPMGDLTHTTPAGPSSRTLFKNPTYDELRRPLPGGPGPMSTSWVNDFHNMNLNKNPWEPMHGIVHSPGGPVPAQAHPANASANHAVLHPMSPPSTQWRDYYQTGPGYLPGGAEMYNVQQSNVPRGPTMAPSNEQALDDVFAELFANADKAARAALDEPEVAEDKTKADNDIDAKLLNELEFQDEMDQWMAANGSSSERDQQVDEETMGDLYTDEFQYPGGLDPLIQHTKPVDEEEEQERRALEDDYKLRKAAQDIMQTLSTNKSEKFKNSSFVELMNRICQKEVVLQGNDLFDTTTGTVLGNTTDTAESERAQVEAHDPKGKGKAKEVTNDAA